MHLFNRPKKSLLIFDDPSVIRSNGSSTIFNKFSTSIYFNHPSNKFNILEYLPREYTISTKNGSYKFNTELLNAISSKIESSSRNQNKLIYHINIADNKNVLKKFEQLFQGKLVFFNLDELDFCQRITDILEITCLPNYMRSSTNKERDFLKNNKHKSIIKSNYTDSKIRNGVIISKKSFIDFAKKSNRPFKIITHKKEYNCNYYGIFFSKIIRDFIAKEPTANSFVFDYEDENGYFQLICDYFNFDMIFPNIHNINSLREMAEALQIDSILINTENYISDYENIIKRIEEQQKEIDTVDQIFNLLYHINEITINKVKLSIIQSNWIKTIDNVKELAAFILQVIRSDILLHQNIAELLIQT